ncbi:MAG: hypothetical protein ISS88_00395 [Candidatus Portnoybacteria bacterium]|nr:hypothetical protein [Candidatus Portnoybacteria bacterium]
MIKIKKIKYCLLVAVCCLLFFTSAQSQTSQIGITLTWSTDTYVPIDYSGKALPSRGSIIEVAANIDSKGVNPQELVYNWFLDDRIQKADSGQGKQVFQFNIGDRITRKRLVKVETKNTAGTLLGTSSYLSLKPCQPEIALETKALLLESSNLTQKYQISANQEIKFIAQPYFFNIKSLDELDYKWSLGGKTASQISSENPNIFILKVGQIGQSIKQDLSVWVENKNNPLQRTQTTAEINIIP